MNDGLVDIVLEVTPTTEQHAERPKTQRAKREEERPQEDERERTRNPRKIQA
jgi:hypothetical protein